MECGPFNGAGTCVPSPYFQANCISGTVTGSCQSSPTCTTTGEYYCGAQGSCAAGCRNTGGLTCQAWLDANCGGGGGGGGSGDPYCGDGVCNNGENCNTCSGDCGGCSCTVTLTNEAGTVLNESSITQGLYSTPYEQLRAIVNNTNFNGAVTSVEFDTNSGSLGYADAETGWALMNPKMDLSDPWRARFLPVSPNPSVRARARVYISNSAAPVCTARVFVNIPDPGPPKISVTANGSSGTISVASGANVNIAWTGEDAYYCTSPAYSTWWSQAAGSQLPGLTGTQSGPMNAGARTFAVTCYGHSGLSTTGQVTVNIAAACTPTNPDTPTLSSPSNNSTISGSTVSFSWTNGGSWGDGCPNINSSYVQISDRVGGVCSGTWTNAATNNHPVTPGNSYCWRVLRTNGSRTVYSSTYVFSVSAICTVSDPTVPTQNTPADNATFSGSSVSFTWTDGGSWGNGCPNVNASNVQIRDRIGGVCSGTWTDAATNNQPVTPGNSYCWRVRRTNGSRTVYSTVRSFTVSATCTPSNPDTPTQSSPANNSTVSGSAVSFSWTNGGSWGDGCPNINNSNVQISDRVGGVCSGTWTNAATNNHPVTPGNSYCWRVIRSNGSRTSYSSTWVFSVTATCTPSNPDVPSLISPANNSSIIGSSVSFNWTDSGSWGNGCPNVNVSNVQIRDRIGGVCSGTWTNASTSNHPVTPGNSYCWRVIRDNGSRTSYSSTYVFSATAACTPSDPSIPIRQIPSDNATISGSSVSFSWTYTAPDTWGAACPANNNTVVVETSPRSGLGACTGPWTVANTNNHPVTDGSYYCWRVVRSNGNRTVYSTIGNFSVCTATAPAQSSLILPADNTTINAQPTSFTWSDTGTWGTACPANINNSFLQIAQRNFDNTCGAFTDQPGSSYDFSAAAGNRYCWRVRRTNGSLDTFSTTRYLDVCQPSVPVARGCGASEGAVTCDYDEMLYVRTVSCNLPAAECVPEPATCVSEMSGQLYIDNESVTNHPAPQSENFCEHLGNPTVQNLTLGGGESMNVSASFRVLGDNYTSVPVNPDGSFSGLRLIRDTSENHAIRLTGYDVGKYMCVCPNIDCTYSHLSNGGQADLNFYLTDRMNAWLQVRGGDVHVENQNGQTRSFENPIPFTCKATMDSQLAAGVPLSSVACLPYTITRAQTNAENTSGIMTNRQGQVVRRSDGNWTTKLTQDDPEVNSILEPREVTSSLKRQENYAYFYRLFEVGYNKASDFDTQTLPAKATLMATQPGNSEPYFYYDPQEFNYDRLIIDTDWSVAANEKITLFVDGDVEIGANTTVAVGGFLGIIASGNITIEPDVTQLQGVIITDGQILIDSLGDPASDVQLLFEGTMVGWQGIDVARSFRNNDNNTNPIFSTNYRPDFAANAPLEMLRSRFRWSQVAP